MTITTIVEVAGTNEQPQDDRATITRADVKDGSIRLFEGRKLADRIGIMAGFDVGGQKPEAVEARVAGILAALTFPISPAALRTSIEDGLAEAEKRSGSVIPDAYRYTYGVDQNNGDDVALRLKDYCGGGLKDPMDLSRLEAVADANGIRDRLDVWMAKDLNNGMLRMNTGNVLRGMVRKGDMVRIGDAVWNDPALTQA